MTSLAELCSIQGLDLQRDAEVRSLGFIEIPLDARLVFAVNAAVLDRALSAPSITAILTHRALGCSVTDRRLGLATASDPRRAFVELHNKLVTSTHFYGAPTPTQVDPSAEVHARAHIDEHSVTIGARCRIEAGAVVLQGTRIGTGSRIMSGAVVGSQGFQTMRFEDEVIDFQHAGQVEIGERTVVMANAVIARAVFRQATRIGDDCRIGNGAFVSHNVEVGARTLIGHGAVVAGNCRIGREVTVGPGAVCVDRLNVGERAFVTAGAVVTKSVDPGQRVSGNFAVAHEHFLEVVKRVATGNAW
jgi:acetyltransferase-like isoleucine patch superfamily enzyme